jgi:hypothetical protein
VEISLFYRFYYVFAVSGGFFGYVCLVRASKMRQQHEGASTCLDIYEIR